MSIGGRIGGIGGPSPSLESKQTTPTMSRFASSSPLSAHMWGDTEAVSPHSLEQSGANTAHVPKTVLASLLNLSCLRSPHRRIFLSLRAIARELLCNYNFTIAHDSVYSDYEILELELYLQKSGCHEDLFTLGNFEHEQRDQ
ncbi:hypothetical protein F5J12DRAFT_267496 [Pisolithus orientalis]|uniref:uncharacterized protein n=1 Tax=Pisolithus orientalis TaxID=936130 RepID=UPI00222566B4|nr:uncharacterized protein F5J12DRAFT_267496 [Pisolithus orientalis]KAI5999789.1 hypothetical protein F5J12DRAFT_267496 [Pisolithus orientalis]